MMAEHYDPAVPSDERAQFAAWFALCWSCVDSDGFFDVKRAIVALEADRKEKFGG